LSFKIHRNPLRRPLVLDDGILLRRIGLCRPFGEVASRRTPRYHGRGGAPIARRHRQLLRIPRLRSRNCARQMPTSREEVLHHIPQLSSVRTYPSPLRLQEILRVPRKDVRLPGRVSFSSRPSSLRHPTLLFRDPFIAQSVAGRGGIAGRRDKPPNPRTGPGEAKETGDRIQELLDASTCIDSIVQAGRIGQNGS
jgi:hypothetical protein